MPRRALIPIFDPPRPRQAVAVIPGPPRRVALLCGGHSLKEVWSEDKAKEYDLIVAVNGACFLFSCDYAVVVDSPVVRKLLAIPERRPRIALVTYAKAYLREARAAKVALITIENIPRKPDGNHNKSYSAPRALQFALKQCGPGGRVDLYGVDMSNAGHDVAGLKSHNNALRWAQESECLRLVWDGRVGEVVGLLNSERLAFLRGERASWPG